MHVSQASRNSNPICSRECTRIIKQQWPEQCLLAAVWYGRPEGFRKVAGWLTRPRALFRLMIRPLCLRRAFSIG